MNNVFEIELKIEDNFLRFSCNQNAPISHIKEAIFKLIHIIAKIEESALEEARKNENTSLENKTQE